MIVQHGALEHAGVVFGAQHVPAAGFPQPTPHTPQFACARAAHCASHRVLQQNGSNAQIAWQQLGSEQPRPLWAKQQLCGTPHCACARCGLDRLRIATNNATRRVGVCASRNVSHTRDAIVRCPLRAISSALKLLGRAIMDNTTGRGVRVVDARPHISRNNDSGFQRNAPPDSGHAAISWRSRRLIQSQYVATRSHHQRNSARKEFCPSSRSRVRRSGRARMAKRAAERPIGASHACTV